MRTPKNLRILYKVITPKHNEYIAQHRRGGENEPNNIRAGESSVVTMKQHCSQYDVFW